MYLRFFVFNIKSSISGKGCDCKLKFSWSRDYLYRVLIFSFFRATLFERQNDCKILLLSFLVIISISVVYFLLNFNSVSIWYFTTIFIYLRINMCFIAFYNTNLSLSKRDLYLHINFFIPDCFSMSGWFIEILKLFFSTFLLCLFYIYQLFHLFFLRALIF